MCRLPDADIEPVQGAEVSHPEVAKNADAEVTVEGARRQTILRIRGKRAVPLCEVAYY